MHSEEMTKMPDNRKPCPLCGHPVPFYASYETFYVHHSSFPVWEGKCSYCGMFFRYEELGEVHRSLENRRFTNVVRYNKPFEEVWNSRVVECPQCGYSYKEEDKS